MRVWYVCSKEDVTRTMYMGQAISAQLGVSTDDSDAAKTTASTNKVDDVCEAVRAAVRNVDADRWLPK